MKLSPVTPAKSLNKAYLKQSLKREEMDLFKENLTRLLDKINEKESEEHLKNLVSEFLDELSCTYFALRDYVGAKQASSASPAFDLRGIKGEAGESLASPLHNETKLINLYKLLSPPHLLKQSFANDANSLNREFYNELLHIIGLEETKEGGKKFIRRKMAAGRNEGSLLENSINVLSVQRTLEQFENHEQFGTTDDEKLFSIGLELCIIWLNRILFLKLLEGQLITYQRGDRSYTFLKQEKISDFDDLQELFFEVLARRLDDRSPSVSSKYGAVPYLNSSLFEISDLERKTIQVSNLKGRLEIPVHGATVLKDAGGKRITGNRNTLGYLFEFLDAYDFASEGKADIQETAKTIINASVLGLIFEKINGYRDGSFFTPGFITMYMSREAIRRAVLRKFREQLGYACEQWDDLCDKLDYTDKGVRQKANTVINSLRICDPAVGSGHFLVSALNEIIAVKSDLHILNDREGKRLHGCVVTIENDELIVTVEDELFVYNPKNPESRRIQEALFHEKQMIIEQCLFGVDINPKSVSICRLRLWIELLKNAYYTRESGYAELETLPNIDINIKCGNSLISRFAITGVANVYATERYKLKAITDRYKKKVSHYKQAPANKHILLKEIDDLKEALQGFAVPTDPDLIALRKIKNNLDQLGLGMVSEEFEKYRAMVAQEEELKRVIADKKNTVYAKAFEWRYEFPEVLDDEGEFVGFDLVIGNPPYMRADGSEELLAMRRHIIASNQYETLWEKWDLYVPFMELGYKLLRENGFERMIVSDTYCHAKYAQKSQEWFLNNCCVTSIDFIGTLDIFDEANVHNVICFFEKRNGTTNRPVRRLHEGEFGSVRILATDEQHNLTYRAFFPEDRAQTIFSAPTIQIGDICYLSYGLAASSDEKLYKGEFVTEDVVSDTRNSTHPKPWVEGKLLSKWLPIGNKWLEWGTERSPTKFRRVTFEELYEVPEKILIVRIASENLKSCYDNSRLYTNHTSILCVPWHSLKGVHNNSIKKVARYTDENPPRPDLPNRENLETLSSRFSVKYLLAILNSNAARNFLRLNRRSNTDLYPDDWKKLPIPDVTKEQQAPIILLVDQILASRQTDPKADILALESEIDQLVYALYGLTDGEIALVEGKA